MRPSARSLAASTVLRYGTLEILRSCFFRNASNRKSSAPVTPAQFMVPGSARMRLISSSSVCTGNADGTDMAMMVLETRAIGARSDGLYGRLSRRYGCAVNDELGEYSRT